MPSGPPNRPYYSPNTTQSDSHYKSSKEQMGNPSTEESQRQVFSARCDVRSFADAVKFLKEEWGEMPESRSDAIDWCVEVVAQLYREVTGLERTESFEKAYDYLKKQGITFTGSERTEKIMKNNLTQDSVQGLMSQAPSNKKEADEVKAAATLAEEVKRLKKQHPDWGSNKIVREAKKNLDIPLETERQKDDGPTVTGSSEGLADIPQDVDTAEDPEGGDD